MKRTGWTIVAALAVAALLPWALRAQAPAKSAAGNAENGKKIYTADGCYECHGREAQGGSGTGPRIGPSALKYEAFLAYVRHPKGQMPPYPVKSISDQDLADVFAFLQSRPKAADPKTIPLLNQ